MWGLQCFKPLPMAQVVVELDGLRVDTPLVAQEQVEVMRRLERMVRPSKTEPQAREAGLWARQTCQQCTLVAQGEEVSRYRHIPSVAVAAVVALLPYLPGT